MGSITVNHSVLCYCWLRRTLWLWDGSPQLTDGPSGGPSIVAPDHLLLLTLIQKRKKHLSIFESTVSLVQTQTAFELATTEKTAREATSTALIDGHRRAHGCPSANWRRLRQCCQLSHLSSWDQDLLTCAFQWWKCTKAPLRRRRLSPDYTEGY